MVLFTSLLSFSEPVSTALDGLSSGKSFRSNFAAEAQAARRGGRGTSVANSVDNSVAREAELRRKIQELEGVVELLLQSRSCRQIQFSLSELDCKLCLEVVMKAKVKWEDFEVGLGLTKAN